jgi:hypothetical protein
MGGGGGVSIPGTFRIATDRTVCQCIFTHSLLFSTSKYARALQREICPCVVTGENIIKRLTCLLYLF